MPRLVSNPPNPWLSQHVEWLEEPPVAALEVYEEHAKTVLAKNNSPDVSFGWSVNPYRGCWHACAYCFARPNHQLLGFGAGTDFERKIVVKVNAPEALAKQLARPSWKRETIVFSGNTDCYQPLEASYQLTRRCLEACLRYETPVALITKGPLVRRDIDVLAALAKNCGAHVTLSIAFRDADIARALEPGVASPAKRFEAMRALADAGVPTGIGVAPIVPGLNDSDVPELLERARGAGASDAFLSPLRLAAEVLPVFRERLHAAFPERAKKIESAIREMRGGAMNDSRFGYRMAGRGPRWEAVERMFDIHSRRLGFNEEPSREPGPTEPRETARAMLRQGTLFDG